jgi:hypothetical protein
MLILADRGPVRARGAASADRLAGVTIAFVDPFGHVWSVGDRSPLGRH